MPARALAALFFLGLPFWQARPPEKWSDLEVQQMLSESPWAQTIGPVPITIYLATALPIEEAEDEARRRGHTPWPRPDFDYSDYVRLHREEDLVVAVPYPTHGGFGTPEQQRTMEEESTMRVGTRSYQVLGFFAPTQQDPVLRVVFPRRVEASDKSVSFRLYLPGMSFPEREVEFRIKDLNYRGKLEM
ncbi:MAG: hypothetical protein C5B51_19250 [Terriglobia bacterium]|nr:MAG: hypothetical protein C5B51_19250 [Terriglobia bacterium]